MKRILLTLLAASAAFAASPVAGTWNATMDTGNRTLQIVLKITEDAGSLKGTVANRDSGEEIPVAAVKLDDNKLELDIPAQRGKYLGTVDGDTITGQWTAGANSHPLNFLRESGKVILTAAERAFAMTYLERTRKEFVDSIRGLTQAQWNYKPSNGGWSIAECAEHITLSEDLLFGLITQRLLKMPVDPKAARSGTAQDAKIITGLTDRSQKAKAPEALVPSGKYPTPESVLAAFGPKRDRTEEFARTTQEDLRGRISPNPNFGNVDAYQYILFIGGHSSRHTAQLNEVKTDAGYPK
ncbi:MAG: DinB family protein [Bryobacteraceae bacterium]